MKRARCGSPGRGNSRPRQTGPRRRPSRCRAARRLPAPRRPRHGGLARRSRLALLRPPLGRASARPPHCVAARRRCGLLPLPRGAPLRPRPPAARLPARLGAARRLDASAAASAALPDAAGPPTAAVAPGPASVRIYRASAAPARSGPMAAVGWLSAVSSAGGGSAAIAGASTSGGGGGSSSATAAGALSGRISDQPPPAARQVQLRHKSAVAGSAGVAAASPAGGSATTSTGISINSGVSIGGPDRRRQQRPATSATWASPDRTGAATRSETPRGAGRGQRSPSTRGGALGLRHRPALRRRPERLGGGVLLPPLFDIEKTFARERPGDLARLSLQGPPCSAHRERRMVRPAERHAGGHRLHRPADAPCPSRLLLRVSTNSTGPSTSSSIDTSPGAPTCSVPSFGSAVDDLRRIDRRHRDHLLEREAEVQELAHHPGQVGHAGRVAGEDVDVGGDRVGRRSPAAIAASATV